MKNKRITAALVLILIFMVLTALIFTGWFAYCEGVIYSGIAKLISPTLTSALIVITEIGSFYGIAGVIAAMLLLPQTRVKIGVPLALNGIIAGVLSLLLKLVIMRHRPQILQLVSESGYAFPSGHAMNNAALYAMLVLLVFELTKSQKLRIPALIFGVIMPLLIGVSRIYLGVHNLGDVLAGWALGVAVSLLVYTAWVRWNRNRCEHKKLP